MLVNGGRPIEEAQPDCRVIRKTALPVLQRGAMKGKTGAAKKGRHVRILCHGGVHSPNDKYTQACVNSSHVCCHEGAGAVFYHEVPLHRCHGGKFFRTRTGTPYPGAHCELCNEVCGNLSPEIQTLLHNFTEIHSCLELIKQLILKWF